VVEIGRQLLFAVFPLALAYAAASDLLTMTIANRLVAAIVAGFVVLAPFAGLAWNDLVMHFAAGAVVIAIAFGFFAAGWIGGGDAKFAAAVALWLGWTQLFTFTVYASLFGGALTLVLLQFRQWPLPWSLGGQAWLLRLHSKETGIPYGIALAIGALMIYPETDWIKAVDLSRFAMH